MRTAALLCIPAALATAAPVAQYTTPPITLTNIISIVNETEKLSREQSLLTDFISTVKENEQGVLEFQLNFDAENAQFITYEKYASQGAIDVHLGSSYMAELLATEEAEGLKRAENDVHFLDLVTEFIRTGTE